MRKRALFVLTGSDEVLQTIQAGFPAAIPCATSCLGKAGNPAAGSTIVVDPRAMHPCCFRSLRRWKQGRRRLRLIYLAIPASPAILLALSASYPGKIKSLDAFRGSGRFRRPGPLTQRAWRERQRFLAWQPTDERQIRFLALARGSNGFGRPEAEMAGELGIGVRHLCRLVRGWLGCTPKVYLDLIRLDNVTQRLGEANLTLQGIASTFGYGTRRTMTRQFRAFTGLPPSAHRGHAGGRRPPVSRIGPSAS